MKIPEYNRQVGLNIAPRSGVSIKEPEIFRDTSSMERIGKQVLGTAEDMSNVYLDMKKERDKGIVNEFSNQFSMASNEKIRELQEQYKGANSEGIVDAYMEWQDDYIAKRTGFNQDTVEGELYLENDEQIKAAKDSLARSLPSTVNSLSNYVANELETYKKNQFEARVELLTSDAISTADENLQFKLNEINYAIDAQYVGQPPEFIALTKKKLANNVYSSRLIAESSENPNKALVALQNKDYIANTDTKTRQDIETKAINNWKNNIAAKMASADTLDIDAVLTEQDAKVIAPYVEKYGKDRLEWDIVKQARTYIGKKKQAETDKKNKDTIQGMSDLYYNSMDNSITLDKRNSNEAEILSKMPADMAEDYVVTKQNIEQSQLFNYMGADSIFGDNLQYITNPKLRDMALQQKVELESLMSRERNPQQIANYMDIIDSGGTVKLSELHPDDAKYLIDRYAEYETYQKHNQEYSKLNKNSSLDKYLLDYWKGYDKETAELPIYQHLVKVQMASKIQDYKNANGSFPIGVELNKIITSSIIEADKSNPNISKLRSVEFNAREKNTGITGFIEEIEDKFGDSLSKADSVLLAEALFSRSYNQALYLTNPEIMAKKQVRQQKESVVKEKGGLINTVKDIAGGTVNIVNTIDDALGGVPSSFIDTVSAPFAYMAEDITSAGLEIEDKYKPIAKTKKATKQVAKWATKPTEYIAEQGITSAVDIAKNIDNRTSREIVDSDFVSQAEDTYKEFKNNESKTIREAVKSAYKMLKAKQNVYKNNPTKANAKEVERAAIKVNEAAGNIAETMFEEPNKERKQKGWWGMLVDYMLNK